METFLIVDGNSLLYRAFYALPLLSNKKGEYSNAVYGFCNMFLKVIAENRPDKIVVAFDFGKKNFRHELFCDYKGTRKATPSELIPQFVLVKDLLKKMNVKVIEQSGIEADDILGTLAKSSDIKTIILSGDKDVLQLIDKNTEVWLTKRGISDIDIVTTKNIEEKFFLSPKQIVDYKAICGETSDNIPGVMGIGDKGALNLLKEFGSLENIYANIDKISGKLKDKLEAGKDSAFLSLKLATIKTDCEIGFNIEEYGYDYPFNRAVFDFFEQYDFRSLLKRQELFEEVFEPKQIENKIESETISIKDAKKLEAIIKCAKEEGQFAFSVSDGVCFSVSENVKYVIESELNLFNLEDNFKACILGLKPIFENEKIVKIFANYKAALYFLKSYDISVCGEVFDLTIMEYLLSSGGRQEEISYESNLFFALKDEKEEKLKQLNLWQLYKKIDLPLVNVLFTMENNGFKIDVEILDELSKKYLSELRALEKEIFEIAGEEFNINSPKQLSVILFDKLGIKCYGNKKKSTGIEVLNEIEGDHQIVSLIIKYRKVQKLNGTYIESYKKIVQSSGEIIHTVFNQTTTSTGRLSSSEPNLQNIPVRDDEGKNLRKLFVSRFENGKIISADYNQIELRLLADFSCDKRLIEDFNAKKDIHAATASNIFCKPISEISQNERRKAKAVNFGVVYGISDYGLSQNIKISRREAKEYIEKYFDLYPSVKKYMDSNIERAKQQGFIDTIFSRRRNLPEITASNFQVRTFNERVAMNMPLQGSASDIIKLAMIDVQSKLESLKLKSKLILQIHDELIIDACFQEEEIARKILKESMENVVRLKVDLPVEICSGKNWFECK